GKYKDLIVALGSRTKGLPAIAAIKTFTLGLEPGEELTLTTNFQMTSAKTATDFVTFLKKVDTKGAKSSEPAASPAQEKEQWVTWQLRGDVPTIRAWLNAGKDVKKGS